jgi:NAD+ synthase (glutamine-hydrolysing)
VLTPELSICGYAAEDLFLRPAFIQACDDAVKTVAHALAGLKDLSWWWAIRAVATAAHARWRSKSASMRPACCRKVGWWRPMPSANFPITRCLTSGAILRRAMACVFSRQVSPGSAFASGLLICEDAWFAEPARLAREAGAQMLAVINASPFHVGKGYEREEMMRQRVCRRQACRWCMPIWWVDRTRWCLKGIPLC